MVVVGTQHTTRLEEKERKKEKQPRPRTRARTDGFTHSLNWTTQLVTRPECYVKGFLLFDLIERDAIRCRAGVTNVREIRLVATE